MRPHRGKLWVKRTLECLQLSTFNGQPWQHFAWSNEQKTWHQKIQSLYFYFLNFCWSHVHVHCEDWCMPCYRIVNTPSALLDQVSTSRGRSFGVPAQVIPFSSSSTEGALGLPKAKSWWEHRTEYVLCPVYHGCIITAVLLQSVKSH